MSERGDGDRDDKGETRPSEPPVDGPGAAEDNEDAGATSYDQPGGSEHGTKD